MYRSALVLSLISLSLSGCWDFAALTDKGARNADGGVAVDLYMCATTISSAREDCTNGVDDNDDCLVDCDDPQCKDFIKCVDPTDKLIGYGSRNATTVTCGANQTSTPINSGITLNGDCSSGCGCQANAAACTSNIHWADDLAKCNAGTYAGNAALSIGTSGGAMCVPTAGPNPLNSSVWKVDTIVSNCPRDTSKNGTVSVSWLAQEKLCTVKGTCDSLDCVTRANHTCLAFSGDVSCPASFPNKLNNWFQSVTDARTCTCTCASQTGSCAVVNATDAQLSDSGTCNGGAKTQNITQAQVNTCVAAALSGGNPPAQAFSYGARPICAAAGTAATNLTNEMMAGRVTLNNPITTCCTF